MRKHWLSGFSFWVVGAIWTMAVGSAQERQMGGVGITVYTDSNFRGKSATFREDVTDLSRHGINDRISSLRVASGEQWEVCVDSYYQGRCVVVSGDEPELSRNSWSDVISSMRRVGSGGARPPARPRPPSQSDWYVVLYDQPNYRGTPTNYNGQVLDLGSSRARSVTIGRGVWELCEGSSFSGRCVTLDRSVPDLRTHGLSNRVSSLRPIGSGGGGGPTTRPTPRPPQAQSDWYIVLYDQPSYRGNPMNYKGPVSDLSGFNRRAQSVTIGKGVWELCEEPNFSGRCVTLDTSVPDLRSHDLSRRVSSVRPVRPQPR
jgi:hypothetical protein